MPSLTPHLYSYPIAAPKNSTFTKPQPRRNKHFGTWNMQIFINSFWNFQEDVFSGFPAFVSEVQEKKHHPVIGENSGASGECCCTYPTKNPPFAMWNWCFAVIAWFIQTTQPHGKLRFHDSNNSTWKTPEQFGDSLKVNLSPDIFVAKSFDQKGAALRICRDLKCLVGTGDPRPLRKHTSKPLYK